MMESSFEYCTEVHEDEQPEFSRLCAQAFGYPVDYSAQGPAKRIGLANTRLLKECRGDKKSIVGTLAIFPMSQWFLRRKVPCAGVSAVTVAAHARNRKVGKNMLSFMLRELHTRDFPISILFPSAPALYRSVGYELVGYRIQHALDLKDIPLDRLSYTSRTIRPFNLDQDQSEIVRVEDLWAQQYNGHLTKNEYLWNRVRTVWGTEAYGYVVENNEGNIDGFFFYIIKREGQGFSFTMDVADMASLSLDTTKAILCFFASQRSMASHVKWYGSHSHPFTLLLPEMKLSSDFSLHLRVVNVASALSARGYPPFMNTQLHLEIHDAVLPENNGCFVLSIADGVGKVTNGGSGHVKMDIGTLATLYGCFATPRDLLSMSRLDIQVCNGANAEEEVTKLEAIFAGPSVTLSEFF